MAWKAPIGHLKKKELLDGKRFYRLLSEHSNYLDEATVRNLYQAFIELINVELRNNKFVRLPLLGDIAIVRQKSRPALVGKTHARIGPRDVVRFYAKERWRRAINARQGEPTLDSGATTSFHQNIESIARIGPENDASEYISPFYRD